MNKLNHIAFIMDGNGRWGKKKRKSRNFGHYKGVSTVKKIVKTSIKFRIPYITFYVFSSENWKRPQKEINYLFSLINNYFTKEIENIMDQDIKINIFGEVRKLSINLKNTLKKTVLLTKNNKKICVNLAINYGSKNEILNSVKKVKKKFSVKKIEANLFTKNIPHPEILIRTGGHKRLSNFMLWQLEYTELFFLKKLWPDFNSGDLKKIVNKYKSIKRNFGDI